MIQIDNLEEINREDIPQLLKLIDPVLEKRKRLYKRLNRTGSSQKVFYTNDNKVTNIPFEQFITAIASGYLAGKEPNYEVQDTDTESKQKIIKDLLDIEKDSDYREKMNVLVSYITNYNDDGTEHFNLTYDALGLTSCYEILWEDKNNEIRYKNYDPLQTVAIYDYTVDRNLIGLVRKFETSNIKGDSTLYVEVIDKNGTRTFEVDKNYREKERPAVTELEPKSNKWGDVPATCYEGDFSIFETVVDLIDAFEQIIQNNRNVFEYNDSGCKLKVKGYSPQNPMLIEQEVSGQLVKVQNPDRLKEDNFILQTKVFYVGDEGDIGWITKDVNDNATQNTIKTYLELITMMSCVPNVTDTGFTNADNNSAIKNKYFALSQKLIKLRKGFEMMYQRRWELIFGRINLKKNEKFDFRDIKIDLPVNIPTNDQEEIDNILKLKDTLSEETIITKLGYNYESEKAKLDGEAQSNFEENMNNIMNQKGDNNDNNENMANNNDNNNNKPSNIANREEEQED